MHIKKLASQTAASFAMLGLVLGGFATYLPAVSAQTAPEETHTVTITKFVEGEQANAENAQSLSFPMSSSWTNQNGPGAGTYSLDVANSYQAVTTEMEEGSSYTTSEDVTGDTVAASCSEGGAPFALTGYTTGATFEEAAAATPGPTVPAFTNLTEDMHVIVWNDDCSIPNEPETATVTILKYVDGEPATAESAQNMTFDMVSSWNDPEGIGAGSGEYTLSSTSDPVYQAMTSEHNQGATYTTSEVIDEETVAASCTTDGAPFVLEGYSTGSSIEEAENATSTTEAPVFANLQDDQYVIVWNATCDGEVEPGEGDLTITSVEALDTVGTANGTYEDGWSYRFNLTVPTNEENVAFRFSDWVSGDDELPVANNMRISSEQADNDGATVTIAAENVYSANLRMVEDKDPVMPGLQVSVLIEVRIPSGTENGSYVTSYGIRSTPAE